MGINSSGKSNLPTHKRSGYRRMNHFSDSLRVPHVAFGHLLPRGEGVNRGRDLRLALRWVTLLGRNLIGNQRGEFWEVSSNGCTTCRGCG